MPRGVTNSKLHLAEVASKGWPRARAGRGVCDRARDVNIVCLILILCILVFVLLLFVCLMIDFV